jgi:acyl carrier protein
LTAVWIHERQPQWQARRRMQQRAPLTDEQFGRAFFPPDQAPLAAALRRVLAEGRGWNLSRLHPEDRLSLVLPSSALDSLETVEMLMEIESKFGIDLPDESVSRTDTFRDLLNLVEAQGPGCEQWRARLGRLIEERTGVNLGRAELVSAVTPRGLIDLLVSKLHGQLEDTPTCQSQRSFYLLRNALLELGCGGPRTIRPDTPLRMLIPARRARDLWPRLRDAVSARQWPALVRPRWRFWLATGLPILLGVAAGFGLPSLAEWVQGWSLTVGFVLDFLNELKLLTVPLLVLGAWLAASRISCRWKVAFPRRLRTVRGLLPFVATSAQAKWTRTQVGDLVREIMVEQLAARPEHYREDARFIEDLGLERLELCLPFGPGTAPAQRHEASAAGNT